MLRALNHFLYKELLQREEIVAGLVPYLRHDDPEVRLRAASGLLMVDDDSGVGVLREMVRSPEPINAADASAEFRKAVEDPPEWLLKGGDLRTKAAGLLYRYRKVEAAEDIATLARRGVSVGGASLTVLGRSDLLETIERDTRFLFRSAASLVDFGIRGDGESQSRLQEVFETARSPYLRTAAAWSLARLTGDSEYVDYLVDNVGGKDKRVAKYLGSLHTPKATEALVEALGSSDSMTKGYALVNLLFNRPKPHPQAVAKLFESLENPKSRKKFGWSMVSQCSSLLDNPELNRVIRRSWRDSNLKAWETRKNWSPYAWLDDYVLELKYDPYDRSGDRFKW